MDDSTVLENPTIEMPAVPETSAEHDDSPVPPRKKPKRFAASFRFNGFRYLTLMLTLGSAFGFVRLAMWVGESKPAGTFLLVFAGGMLAAAGKTVIDILHWAEANRQTVHLERVRAVQRVFDRARVVREHAIIDWRRIHTVLVDKLSGQPQEIRLFHDHDETDRQCAGLVRKALSEEMWLHPEGVDAARRFQAEIGALNYNALTTEPEFLTAFNALMDRLRRELALAAIGIPLD